MKLAAVRAELHIFDEQINWAEPIRIAFEFDGGDSMRLSGAGDGQGLIIDACSLEPPTDMEEYGRIDIFEFAERLGLANGETIGEPIAIRNPTGQLIGVGLPRTGENMLCIWINGDEFHWGHEAALKGDYWPAGFAPVVDGALN